MSYIEIVLKSDMCAGNGEGSGNSIDTDICTDDMGLPFIPGRRLRGCLRQAAEFVAQMEGGQSMQICQELFGDALGNEGSLRIGNAYLDGYDSMHEWLKKRYGTQKAVSASDITDLFSYVRGQTKLKDGVIVENTLRFKRVLSHYDPLGMDTGKETTFLAWVGGVDDASQDLMEKSCKALRHMGTNRNRGLGNVQVRFSGKDIKRKKPVVNDWVRQGDDETVRTIRYIISLDAPITLPDCDELNNSVPARSVIGCMAGQAARILGEGEERFRDLFLNGKVKWSALTPVIDGEISFPAPGMLALLRNDENRRMINIYAQEDSEWKKKKPKTLEGRFAVIKKDKTNGERVFSVASVQKHTMYHLRRNGNGDQDKMLYMQDSVDGGILYGGTVMAPEKYVDDLCRLISNADMLFGRSKGAQYAACFLQDLHVEEIKETKRFQTKKEEPVAIVLMSDLVCDKGYYDVTTDGVRALLAKKLGIADRRPGETEDLCRYHTIGGFQNLWHMQKPHIPAVCGGSIYWFVADGDPLPEEISVGEYQQEGFGRCRLFTSDELRAISKVEKGKITEVQVPTDETRVTLLESRILSDLALEEMKNYAREIWKKYALGFAKKNLPLARLRGILTDAADLQDLYRRIDNIKESDLSSEVLKSRKECAKELVQCLYGEEVLEKVSRSGDDRRRHLFGQIRKSKSAESILAGDWKIMLDVFLHEAHYGKEGKA